MLTFFEIFMFIFIGSVIGFAICRYRDDHHPCDLLMKNSLVDEAYWTLMKGLNDDALGEVDLRNVVDEAIGYLGEALKD